jgi:invasion protein IalB
MRSLFPAVSIGLTILSQSAFANGPAETENSQGRLHAARSRTQTAQVKQAAPVAPAAPAAAPVAPKVPETRPSEKVETTNFENWILTCREAVDGPKKRSCFMTVAVLKSDNNQPMLSWTVRANESGQMLAIIEMLPGISIAPGIRLQLEGTAAPRKVPIEICEPNFCSGTLAMDKTFVRDASASSKVTIVVTSSAGQPVTLDFPIKGFEKAFSRM